MLRIRHPVPLVLRAIHVDVRALAVGLIIVSLPFVDVTVGVDQAAIAIGLVILPETLVNAPVHPYLFPTPPALFVLSLPSVSRVIIHLVWAVGGEVLLGLHLVFVLIVIELPVLAKCVQDKLIRHDPHLRC